jgi:hypothetical protein
VSTLVANERTKLTAAAVDRASTAWLAVGVFAPMSIGLQATPQLPEFAVAGPVAGWSLVALVLHMVARRQLRRLVQ